MQWIFVKMKGTDEEIWRRILVIFLLRIVQDYHARVVYWRFGHFTLGVYFFWVIASTAWLLWRRGSIGINSQLFPQTMRRLLLVVRLLALALGFELEGARHRVLARQAHFRRGEHGIERLAPVVLDLPSRFIPSLLP